MVRVRQAPSSLCSTPKIPDAPPTPPTACAVAPLAVPRGGAFSHAGKHFHRKRCLFRICKTQHGAWFDVQKRASAFGGTKKKHFLRGAFSIQSFGLAWNCRGRMTSRVSVHLPFELCYARGHNLRSYKTVWEYLLWNVVQTPQKINRYYAR